MAAASLAMLVVVGALIINWLVTDQVGEASRTVLAEQATDRAQLLEEGADPSALVAVIGDEVVAAIFGPDGEVRAASGTPDPTELRNLPEGVSRVTVSIVETEGGVTEIEREPIWAASVTTAGGSTVVVGNEGEEARQVIQAIRLELALGVPLVVLAGGVILWMVTGRALRPVGRIRDDLDQVVSAGAMGRVTEPGTRDEVDDLARTLNDVLGRLEQQSVARRQFVADASHELKSPVANARILVETGGSAEEVVVELDRLRALVDDLLFLARSDEHVPPEPADFDLDDVVFDEAERAARVRPSVRLDASAVQPARVRADSAEVARALRNLLENAVRHARTEVRVAIDARSDFWVVSVTDDGPGVPLAQRARMFERFTRLGDDRSRDDGGTGLGLSIVADIAQRNRGSVDLVEHPGPGARFELCLPRAEDGASSSLD
jgi:signal transduction histidine kinase